jgi:RND family efflux transporter MFP subunit
MQKVLNVLKRFKWLLILVIVAGVGGYYAYGYYQEQNKPKSTGRQVKVERGDIIAMVSATGTISPVDNVDVSSKITGRITDVKVVENQYVKADDILIVLDDSKYRAQLAQAGAKLANAEANYERARKMALAGGYSRQQLDAARTDYEVARATYDDAESNLEDTVIKAPIAGMVIGKPIPAGQTVSPGISNPMVLLTIADLNKMQIQALVDESDIGKIQLNQKVSFTVDAYPDKTFAGKVSTISNKANVQQNVVYYSVLIDVDSPEGLLKPTMTARVSVHVGERRGVLMVPTLAIKDNRGQRFVNVLRNGNSQPESVKITTGLASEDRIEVVSGLKEGDTIVLPQSAAGSNRIPGMGGMGGTGMFRQTPAR